MEWIRCLNEMARGLRKKFAPVQAEMEQGCGTPVLACVMYF
jgi:hypothetical protein